MGEAPFIGVFIVRLFIDKLTCEPIELAAIRIDIFAVFICPVSLAGSGESHLRGEGCGIRYIHIQADSGGESILQHSFHQSIDKGETGREIGIRRVVGVVFDHATFTIKRGEKVAFVGKNGEGKSTLVKCIMGQIPFTGNLKVGHNVKIGYFAQNQAQLMDGEITVFDTIDHVATGDIRTKIRDILGAFMFGGEASDKKVKVLSGGEKTRLAMIRLLLEPVNLLILDEPTNHLDMPSKDVLKQAIKDFDGTVIVVSHDREFLDGLVEKVYEFGGGQVKECLGGIYEFLEKKRMASLSELERRTPATESKAAAAAPEAKKAAAQEAAPRQERKLSYAEQRERDKAQRRARKKVEETEAEVARMEAEVKAIEQELAEGATDPEIYTRHEAAVKRLENAMSLWELASIELEEFDA